MGYILLSYFIVFVVLSLQTEKAVNDSLVIQWVFVVPSFFLYLTVRFMSPKL